MIWIWGIIDLFTDMAAILNSIVSNSYYGMLRGKISMYLPPEHPIIDFWNNRISNGHRIGKKVYWSLQLYTQLEQLLWNWSLKKIQAWTGFELRTSGISVQCSINWVILPAGSWSLCEFVIYILHPLQVHYEPPKWLAPSWVDSSVDRALHRYCRSHGFKSHSGLNFFQTLISQLSKLCL